ncbi:AAA family ATPase [Pseudomonas carnis]|jgi:putative ATP-dependent endonuclease of OLD family|uniref:ATP-dependent nuclease n=1 Tax=Pseudomonas TaxID=286 RepID=UPI000C9B72CD|nr:MULTISPECIES: AAA family ATPase [Pseudomonas]MBH3366476.1 AAA family ATPase [Pseudomonas carnis]MBJ2231084.1 AAA family ATPase [Pseudomonas simiae]MDI3185443.1 AAA family ATPase [Pseudomonas paracarnis]MQT50560.1 AAA family ATPase [Pseudomonas sp. FSL R10-2398]NMZ38853.1 AAA family ATPase [Pseudomonas proteolytica]
MFIERLNLINFRCFGPEALTIDLTPGLTAFIGVNGAGKTAVMQALQRLFGITGEHRRLRLHDFHIPADETAAPVQRTFVLEAIIAFPELENGGDGVAIPEFFNQMAADEAGRLKCRLRLEATWTDDGSLDGFIEQKYRAVRNLGEFNEADCIELKAIDRNRIQMIYVPASRDGASQVTAFLRGRLWRAINWSQGVRDTFSEAGATLNGAFAGEPAVDLVAAAVQRRWQEVHNAGTETTPLFRPVDLRFQEFIRKVEVVFHPDIAGRERALDELSDGQRSLFHLAMTAATLDVEGGIADDPEAAGFQPGGVPLPALTLIAVEEPENNLAPFYLSRIVRQIEDLTSGNRAQAVISSHSASILARVDPSQVRHFRLDPASRTARVRAIKLPIGQEEASKFVREAVRTYPELYFARFAVLGEGATEEVVLPRLAEAMGFDIDRSFVAVVPLGGRHVNHLWRLLADLDIPYATLLDLDWGRDGGGWGRIKTACAQLLENGVSPQAIFAQPDPAGPASNLAVFDTHLITDFVGLTNWATSLRRFNVFFCSPLDLDYSMMRAFPAAYQVLEPGRLGPSQRGDPRTAVLGDEGQGYLYGADQDQLLRWYRYLFLGRGKPSTHVRVLSAQTSQDLTAGAPEELRAILTSIAARLAPPVPPAPPVL